MAGIYLHVPFCKQACYYCDFHFSTSIKNKTELLEAMNREIILQKDYLQGATVETIYFGGGTPSLLSHAEIELIMETIHHHHNVAADAEVTLEANPDDLDIKKIIELRRSPVNRLSIGIQSFYEEDLQWMNRAHNAVEAHSALENLLFHGFENITVDLIYGYPLLDNEKWADNIQKVLSLGIPHLSAYGMTVETKTALHSMIAKGKYPPMDEQQSAEQFLFLIDTLTANGYEHYEISNFAKAGRYARHNSNYWKGVPYLGIGPSAHSYNGGQRSWNAANNHKYVQAIAEGILPQESEVLSSIDQLNEYIMVSLRTIWGMELDYIETHFGSDKLLEISRQMSHYIASRHLKQTNGTITLTKKGKLMADKIAADLFF